MALRPKNLGQTAPAAGAEVDVYAVPTAAAVMAKLHVTNRGSVTDLVRVAKRVGGVAVTESHYRAFDVPIAARDDRTWSIIAEAGDIITVRSSAGLCTFTLEGLLRS